MDPDPLLSPPDSMGDDHWYTKKIGPLPVWAYLTVAVAIVGYIWYKDRQNSSSSNSTDQYGLAATDTTAGAQGYTEGYGAGYDTGYATGINPGGTITSPTTGINPGGTITSPTPTPTPKTPQYCRDLKDPSGATRHVCGFGHWFQPKGQTHWYWTPGPVPKDPLRPGREVAVPNPFVPNRTVTNTGFPK